MEQPPVTAFTNLINNLNLCIYSVVHISAYTAVPLRTARTCTRLKGPGRWWRHHTPVSRIWGCGCCRGNARTGSDRRHRSNGPHRLDTKCWRGWRVSVESEFFHRWALELRVNASPMCIWSRNWEGNVFQDQDHTQHHTHARKNRHLQLNCWTKEVYKGSSDRSRCCQYKRNRELHRNGHQIWPVVVGLWSVCHLRFFL